MHWDFRSFRLLVDPKGLDAKNKPKGTWWNLKIHENPWKSMYIHVHPCTSIYYIMSNRFKQPSSVLPAVKPLALAPHHRSPGQELLQDGGVSQTWRGEAGGFYKHNSTATRWFHGDDLQSIRIQDLPWSSMIYIMIYLRIWEHRGSRPQRRR